ncbi:MAG: phage terminase small subunit P27 family [Pseudomonadales bacterium]|nr:phage terminase small subunit P27 family [Pseudomonadales bacterium]
MSVKKPTAIKKLDGNPGNRPLPENEVQPKKILPKPPRHLSKDARKAWRILAPQLFDLGLLTELDVDLLGIYCETYIMWRDAKNDIVENGYWLTGQKGDRIKNPSISIARSAFEQMHKMKNDFGFSPAARVGLSIGNAPIKTKDADDWEGLIV